MLLLSLEMPTSCCALFGKVRPCMPRVHTMGRPTQPVAQIYLYGNGLRSYLLAVVVPSQGERMPPILGT